MLGGPEDAFSLTRLALSTRGAQEQILINRELQQLGNLDAKTSSWVKTPSDIRKLGGALFCDRRFGRVFVYHNGAQSYYSARAFRGSLRV
jgi:hypothetical protein